MRNFTTVYIVVFIFLGFSKIAHSQIVISKPNLGFSQACASPSFNTYSVTFSFSPEAGLSTSNQFIIELSDDSGSFSNPTELYASAQGTVTVSPATLSFSVPTSISGEAFKIRIKSTAPVATSTGSDAFAAYYKIQDTPFSINNLIDSGVYCNGGSYLLTIDNPGTGDNDSPLKYPSLTFNWFKETSPTTSVFVAQGNSLSVNQPGTYFAETNYGTCTSNSFSNRVTVSESGTTSVSSINSSLGNPFCASQGTTTLSAINGNSYQWYKDGIEIPDATEQMYTTNESGLFSVNIDLGDCTANASIDLQSKDYTSSINVSEYNVIEPDEVLTVTITTTANNPEFQWYLNDSMILNASDSSYEATQIGNYKAVVTQTTGCVASTEFLFQITEAFPAVDRIPNLISPNVDGYNDTWVIPQIYVSGTNTEVQILNSQGETVLKTKDYLNDWPQTEINFKDINPVFYYIITTADNKIKKGSITVIK